jgi:FemAB family protein
VSDIAYFPKELINCFSELLKKHELMFSFRTDNSSLWFEVSNKTDYLPVIYTSDFINYEMAYNNGEIKADNELIDISIILYNDSVAVGIWPLSINCEPSSFKVSSFSNFIAQPIFVANTSVKTIKKLTKSCIAALQEFASKCDVSSDIEYESCIPFKMLDDWHKTLMQNGANILVQHELYIDLSLSLKEIKAKLRKSYKALITSGMKLWSPKILLTKDSKVWEEFKELHRNVAGRKTRSDYTWELQHEDIKNGTSFLVYLQDDNYRMVGGGLFRITKDEALYSVGVYDRSLFDKPLGHIVQWCAIQEMKNKGLKWYKLGRRYYPSDKPTPTEKEISISYFKEGFSTHTFPRLILNAKV